MNAYVLVYAFLGILMGAMVYVVGTPWLTLKPRKTGRRRTQEDVSTAHR